MSAQRRVGPLQLLLIGFSTTERFRGDILHELLGLRGRGLLRVLDARLFQRTDEGFTEIDLNPLLADTAEPEANPISRLMRENGGGSNGGHSPAEAIARTSGFALDDLRKLKELVEPSDHTVAVLVEHQWAAHLQDAIRDAGGMLLGQGMLTREVEMIVGDEVQARADAEAAIEIAQAARGAALLDALSTLAERGPQPVEQRSAAAGEIIRVLVDQGYIHPSEAHDAVETLATRGLLELATFEAAVAEVEDVLGRPDEPSD
jgi:hypothetical protein